MRGARGIRPRRDDDGCGSFAAGPVEDEQPEVDGRSAFTPARALTLTVAALLEIAAALVALQGKLFAIGGLPPALIRVGALGVAVVLAARGVGDFRLVGLFKRVRGTRFARLDSCLYAPLCLTLAAGIVIVAAA